MVSLMAMRATGQPDEFAWKMNLSRSTLFKIMGEMRVSLSWWSISKRPLICPLLTTINLSLTNSEM